MSIDISCDLSYFSLYYNHSHESHDSIYVQVVVKDRCVLKKWPLLRIVIGRYGYKSSFGAKNQYQALMGLQPNNIDRLDSANSSLAQLQRDLTEAR